MATCETVFDPFPGLFSIVNFQVDIFDLLPPGTTPPTNIIQDDQDWGVTVRWETEGLINGMVDGEWHLLAFAEGIGPGAEKIIFDPADHIVPLVPVPFPGTSSYTHTLDVDQSNPASPRRLPVVGGHGVTLYRLIISLTYFDASTPRNRGPIACFEDQGILPVYESTP